MDTRKTASPAERAVMPARVCEKDGVFVVDLVGEIRISDDFTPSLQRQVTDLLDEGNPDILLNFAKVDFIDSYGIGDIVAAYLAVQEKKGRLKLCCLSPKIWLIFHYSGLTRILEIFDSEEKALKSFV